MKTILICTDFSDRAEFAAEYAAYIALKNKANIILCHAVETYLDPDDGTEPNWQVEDHRAKKKEETTLKLQKLEINLQQLINRHGSAFKPSVQCIADFGPLDEVAENIIAEKAVDLVVIGSHKSNELTRFLFGSHTHNVLDNISCPVLLVPENFSYQGINSIAYATDLSFNNHKVIGYLIKLAKTFNASVSVNHISPFEFPVTEAEQAVRFSLKEYLASFDPPVFYYNIKGYNIKSSLMEITGSGKADILALVHKRYDFFERLFHASISKQMADSAVVPLLVLPYSFSTGQRDSQNHS